MEKDEFYASARNDLSGPLAGVTVVEATTTWAGPMAACVLADFGARVIKVEHPNGEVARGLPPFIPESNLTVANEIDRDDLASKGALDHIEQRDLVDGLLADYCSNKTVADVVERFAELGLPATRINEAKDLPQEPHVQARSMLVDTKVSDGKTIPLVGPAAKFSRTPTTIRHAAPELGQQNNDILLSLGFSDAEIQALREAGVISS